MLPWLGLVVGHAWLTLGLFGPGDPWVGLTDDRPILSGQHPLHLYHGSLGARALQQRCRVCCYDPAFQAGYPKTPVFDSGSRPAEFALLFSRDNPARTYKLSLAVASLLLPLALLAAVLATGLGHRAAFLATLLGMALWWGEPCQRLLAEGQLDVLLAALSAGAQAGLLLHFHRRPSLLAWLGVSLTGLATWFVQPLFAVLLLPLFLAYYFRVGPRHGVFWHLALWAGLAVALACNALWLADWVSSWWVRVGPGTGEAQLLHRTPRTVWDSALWGTGLDRIVAAIVLGLGVSGAVILNRNGDRPAAQSLGLGATALFVLAMGGVLSHSLARMHAESLLVPSLLLALPLSAYALDLGWRRLAELLGPRGSPVLVLLPAAAVAGWLAARNGWDLATVPGPAQPLDIGFTPEQGRVVEAIHANTSTDGRVLWEDVAEFGSWPALLPWATERSFVGGVDPAGCIEHSACRLGAEMLAGRLLNDWTDAELEAHCRRYNIGWVVAWSPRTIARLKRWPLARPVTELSLDRPGCLFALRRPLCFLLRGKARSFRAGVGSVTLTEVVPEDGEVVLSLHYQDGVTASPSRVRVERELDSRDPIPLIRLRMDGPVARITLTFP